MSDRVSYILPLDSLDLTYLGSHTNDWAYSTPTVLRSRQSLDGELNYYKIEIIADNDDKNSYVVPCDTITCHICNISVPKTYMQQHNTSDKHVINKKIFENVLQRVSKQINVELNDNAVNTLVDEYYCNVCSKIIKHNDKKRHELSNYHNKFKENDKITKDFLEILVEDDTQVNADAKNIKTVNDIEIVNVKNDCNENYFHIKEVNNADSTDANYDEDNIYEELKDNNNTIINYNDISYNNIDIVDKEYDSDKLLFAQNINLDTSEDDSDDKSNYRLNVASVSNSSDKSENFFDALCTSSPELDRNTSNCNIDDVLNVTESKKKKRTRTRKRNKALANNTDEIVLNNVECTTDKLSVAITNIDLPIEGEAVADSSVATPKNELPAGESLDMTLQRLGKSHLGAGSCPGVDIKDDFVQIKNNKGDVLRIPLENYNSFYHFGDQIFCLMCKVPVLDNKTHEVLNSHVEKILRPFNEHFARTVDTNNSHCMVCNEVVLTLSQHHQLNDYHNKKLNAQLVIKLTKPIVEPAQIFCAPCNKYVFENQYLIHLSSKKHKNNDTHSPEKATISSNTSNGNTNDVRTIKFKLTQILLKRNIIYKVENKIFCNVCKKDVSINTLGHINQPKHLEVIFKQLEAISLLRLDFCQICIVQVPINGMEIHIKGRPHTRLKQKIKDIVLNANKLLNDNVTTQGTLSQVNTNITVDKQTPKTAKADKNDSSTIEVLNANNRLNDNIQTKGQLSQNNTNVSKDIQNTAKANKNDSNTIEGHRTHGIIRDKIDKMMPYSMTVNEATPSTSTSKSNCNFAQNLNNLTKPLLKILRHDAINCKICSDILNEHVEYKQKLLDFNKISNDGFCKYCKVTDRFPSAHINSLSHILKLVINNVINKNNLSINIYKNKSDEMNAKIYRWFYNYWLLYNRILRDMYDKKQFNCLICNVTISRVNEIDHSFTEKHLKYLLEKEKTIVKTF